jgi:anti-sigma28 factor (negative regulator of flagellin synthesis)
MEIPNDLRIKRDRLKLDSKKPVGKDDGGAGQAPVTGDGADRTRISGDALALEQAIQAVLQSPDLSRGEKVGRIKQGLADGTLTYNSRDVAEKILQNLIEESDVSGG